MNENLNQDVGLTNTYLIKLILTVVASHAKPSYFAEDSDGESAAKTIKQELFRLGRIVDELVQADEECDDCENCVHYGVSIEGDDICNKVL